MRNLHLLPCLVLSGFAGLAYELLWVRLLALGFGSTTLSFSTVLAVFFGGLALGAWLAGKRSKHLNSPVRTYAWIEIATGILALVLYPAIARVGYIFALVDPGEGILGGLTRALIALPLLLGPTLLMGATLPIVTRAIVVADDDVGPGTALIYGFNTVGAFLGTYLITYILLLPLGVFYCTLLTVGFNVIAGVIALIFETPVPTAQTESSPPETEAAQTDFVDKTKIVANSLAFLTGFAAICFQVVWVRLFSIFLDGTVYGVGSVLIAVLIGIGLGSLLIAQPLKRSPYLPQWFAGIQAVILLAYSILSYALPWIAYTLRSIHESHHGLAAIHLQLLGVFSVLFVPSLASGASFPLLMAIVERKAMEAGQALGQLYAANTIGAILGSLITGFFLIPQAGTVSTLFLGLIIIAFVGATSAFFFIENRNSPSRLLLAVLPLGLVAFWPAFDVLNISLAGRGSATGQSFAQFTKKIVAHKKNVSFFSEGATATVLITHAKNMYSLRLNGLGQGGRKLDPPHHIYESLMVALVPASHVDTIDRALVVGLGAGVTVDALLKLGAQNIDVVELEPQVVEALSYIFPKDISPASQPQVHIKVGDARHTLLLSSRRGPGTYDLITSMPAHPWVASNIFTQEFFELARANLSERGVFSTWFGLGRMDKTALDSLVRAFTHTFKHYVIYQLRGAQALYLVGSKKPLTVDIERFRQLRLRPLVREQPAITSDYHLARQIVASGSEDDPQPQPGPVNTDDSAIVELRAPRTTTAARALSDILPHRYLKADMLRPVATRTEEAIEILEAALGTPRGVVFPKLVPVNPRQISHLLEGFKPILDEHAYNYFRGRLTLMRTPNEARAYLEGVRGPLADRAQGFLPFCFPQGAERNLQFQRTPLRGDILAAQLDEVSVEAVRKRLPAVVPTFENDRWGWLIWQALATTSTPTFTNRQHLTALGPELLRSSNMTLLDVAQTLADRSGWKREARRIEARLSQVRRQRARKLFRRAKKLGAEGQFAPAATLLQESLRLDGGSQQAAKLLIISLIELGADSEQINQAKLALQFGGLSEAQVEHHLTQARLGKLTNKALSSEKSTNNTLSGQKNASDATQEFVSP